MSWSAFKLFPSLYTSTAYVSMSAVSVSQKHPPYRWKKNKTVKSDNIFCSKQYFCPTNNFTRLKLTPIKNFYQLFFLLNKKQITQILKKLSGLLYHNLVERRWVGKCRKVAIVLETDQSKPVRQTAADQSKLVSYTDSRMKKKKKNTSTLTLILMN